MKNKLIITLQIVVAFFAVNATANTEENKKLYSQFVELDNILFEESFNKCNEEVLPPLITSDFEFYHDIAGIQDKNEFLRAVKNNICSNPDKKPIRKLVPGSMEVFPLNNNGVLYGVIQRGVHEFYIKEPGKKIYKTGIAKFTHLWLLQDGKWQLKRVLSFDHQPASD